MKPPLPSIWWHPVQLYFVISRSPSAIFSGLASEASRSAGSGLGAPSVSRYDVTAAASSSERRRLGIRDTGEKWRGFFSQWKSQRPFVFSATLARFGAMSLLLRKA